MYVQFNLLNLIHTNKILNYLVRGGESLMVTVIRCGTGSPKIIQKPEWWVFL